MLVEDFTFSFIVVDNMFTRYTLIVDPVNKRTSVYCEHCDEWVAEFKGSAISTHSQTEMYEEILSSHHEDSTEPTIAFEDSIETLL